MHPRRLTALVVFILLAASACGRPTPQPTPTGLAPISQKVQITQTPTATITPSRTLTPSPTVTSTPTKTKTPTPDKTATKAVREATLSAKSTSQAGPIAAEVEKLYTAGLIDARNGDYHSLEVFDIDWAQMNYGFYEPTGYSPANFVLQTNAEWWSASDKANWFLSGCGFTFRAKDNDNNYTIWLGMDGYVYLWRFLNGSRNILAAQRYSQDLKVPNDKAKLTLVVNQTTIAFYVNDEMVVKVTDRLMENKSLKTGMLGRMLFSGTNKGFGTRCKMTDTDLWVIKPDLSASSGAAESPTETAPLVDWNGVPIMPGAQNGKEDGALYSYNTSASIEEIEAFYKAEMPKQGWSMESSGESEEAEGLILTFSKGAENAMVSIIKDPFGGAGSLVIITRS
jgi:hypothetical protein